jgi:hypothetical protein
MYAVFFIKILNNCKNQITGKHWKREKTLVEKMWRETKKEEEKCAEDAVLKAKWREYCEGMNNTTLIIITNASNRRNNIR